MQLFKGDRSGTQPRSAVSGVDAARWGGMESSVAAELTGSAGVAATVTLTGASVVGGSIPSGVVSVIRDGVTVLASVGFTIARLAGGVTNGDALSNRSSSLTEAWLTVSLRLG